MRTFDGRAAVFARRLDDERSVEVGDVDRAFLCAEVSRVLFDAWGRGS